MVELTSALFEEIIQFRGGTSGLKKFRSSTETFNLAQLLLQRSVALSNNHTHPMTWL